MPYVDALDEMIFVQVEDNRYGIEYHGKIFYVGKLLYAILTTFRDTKDFTQTAASITERFQTVYAPDQIQRIIGEGLIKLTVVNPENTDQVPQPSRYIFGRIQLLNGDRVNTISRWFLFLYQGALLRILSGIALVMTGLFLADVAQKDLFMARITWHDGPILLGISYVFLIASCLFHEFGHSSAATKYGIKSKEIGFGFYLIFPVLYTDISRVWLLNRHQRVLVNLAGIYFQSLLNIGLYLLHVTNSYPVFDTVYISLFLTNTFLILYSLNPYLRNDGYWIYSDYFDLTNLTRLAWAYPAQFLRNFRHPNGGIDQSLTPKQRWALIIYSTFYLSLVALLPLGAWRLLQQNLAFVHVFLQSNQHSMDQTLHVLKAVFLSGLIVYVTINTFRSLYRQFTHSLA